MLFVAIELFEKAGLVASAALISVFVPALRSRFFGLREKNRDRVWIVILGVALSAWGSLLGAYVQGEHMNVRALGVLVAGFLGGRSVGIATGLLAGLFYAFLSGHVDANTRLWVIVASLVDGILAGAVGGGAIGRVLPAQVAARIRSLLSLSELPVSPAPDVVRSPLAAVILACAIQAVHLVVVAFFLLSVGEGFQAHFSAWQAHLAKLIANAAGVALFVAVARIAIENEEHTLTRVALEKGSREAELRELRRRVDPHFLFNALTSVRALVRVDGERARTALTDLAELYRALVAQPDEVLLSVEFAQVERYLAFERARLGDDMLRFSVEFPGDDIDRLVPSLILQPLVENAILHGIRLYPDGGAVRVAVIRSEAEMLIVVENHANNAASTPPHIQNSPREHNGTAIATVRERLRLRYGNAAKFDLKIERDGAVATIHFPLTAKSGR